MKKQPVFKIGFALLAALTLLAVFSGCGGKTAEPAKPTATAEPVTPAEPVVSAEPVATAEPVKPAELAPTAEPAETETATARQDGERFEAVIILEGMEEPVRYEHVRNELLGIEMDYDYELFQRHSEPDSECFFCVYDGPEQPENYLTVTRSPEDADTVAAAIGAELSKAYEISAAPYPLDGAGNCIRIDASADKGGLTMPEQLQMVYVIPAADGCRVATAHYAIEAAEGFGRRFAYMLHTLTVID